MLVLPVFTAKQVSNPGSPSDHLRALLDLRRAVHGGALGDGRRAGAASARHQLAGLHGMVLYMQF